MNVEIEVIEKVEIVEDVIEIEEVVIIEVEKPQPHHHLLHIFVNRRKFTAAEGVKAIMTGAEIAHLVAVPKDKAVIKREQGEHKTEIGVDQPVEICNDEQFLVTRDRVEGGHGE